MRVREMETQKMEQESLEWKRLCRQYEAEDREARWKWAQWQDMWRDDDEELRHRQDWEARLARDTREDDARKKRGRESEAEEGCPVETGKRPKVSIEQQALEASEAAMMGFIAGFKVLE